MVSRNTTVILGIPIPSTDPIFLGIIGTHVLFGLVAVLTGAVAMLSKKGRGPVLLTFAPFSETRELWYGTQSV